MARLLENRKKTVKKKIGTRTGLAKLVLGNLFIAAEIGLGTSFKFSKETSLHQAIVVIAFGHKVEKLARSADDPLRVRDSRRDMHAHRAFRNDLLIADDEFDDQTRKLRTRTDSDVI